MAFPTVVATAEWSAGAGSNNSVPFTQTTGDLVLIIIGLNNAGTTVSEPFNWTNLTDHNSSFHLWCRVLDGSEGGFITFLDNGTNRCFIVYNIQGHDPDITPEFSTVTTGTSTGPDPGTETPTGGAKDYLWIATFRQNGEEADDDTWCNTAPTNFTTLVQKTTGTGGAATANGSIAAALFESNAASMDPGAFNTDQSLAWRAYTIAIHPVAGEAAAAVPRFTPYPQILAH